MAQDLLRSVYEDYEQWCEKNGHPKPGPLEPLVIGSGGAPQAQTLVQPYAHSPPQAQPQSQLPPQTQSHPQWQPLQQQSHPHVQQYRPRPPMQDMYGAGKGNA